MRITARAILQEGLLHHSNARRLFGSANINIDQCKVNGSGCPSSSTPFMDEPATLAISSLVFMFSKDNAFKMCRKAMLGVLGEMFFEMMILFIKLSY